MATRKTAKPAKKKAGKPATKKIVRSAKKKTAKSAKKKQQKTATDAVDRLRDICLSFPEVVEVEAWGEPTFRVRTKIFAMHATASTHHGNGREAVWIASDSTTQDLVLRAKPHLYFSPPYVGPSGWIGAWLDRRPAWNEIADFLRDAYRMKASKKQIARLGDD